MCAAAAAQQFVQLKNPNVANGLWQNKTFEKLHFNIHKEWQICKNTRNIFRASNVFGARKTWYKYV